MGIEEIKEIQIKGIDKLVHKIIPENFPHLEIERVAQVRKLTEHQTIRTKREASPDISQSKHATYGTEKEYLKLQKRKDESYKGKPIRITADFSTQILNARRS
jgi:hypothetical protein